MVLPREKRHRTCTQSSNYGLSASTFKGDIGYPKNLGSVPWLVLYTNALAYTFVCFGRFGGFGAYSSIKLCLKNQGTPSK